MIWRRIAAATLVCGVAFPAVPAFAVAMAVNTVNTQTAFTVSGGGAFTGVTTRFKDFITPFWSLTGFRVVEVDALNDTLSLIGTVQHLMSPVGHGDGAGAPILFSFGVNADNAAGVPNAVSNTSNAQVPHGPNGHTNDFFGAVTALVDSDPLSFADSITTYTFALNVAHCNTCPTFPPLDSPVSLDPVPLPPALWLLASALASVAALGTIRSRRLAS